MKHYIIIAVVLLSIFMANHLYSMDSIYYRECIEENRKNKAVCGEELCAYEACKKSQMSYSTRGGSEMTDRGAEGGAVAACYPHLKIWEQCIKENNVRNSQPTSMWKSGRMEQQNNKGEKYTGEIAEINGGKDKFVAKWKAFDHKRNKVDGNWPITISFSQNVITIIEHHSSQKWVGTCDGTLDSPTITCSGKEETKGNFTFTITLIQ